MDSLERAVINFTAPETSVLEAETEPISEVDVPIRAPLANFVGLGIKELVGAELPGDISGLATNRTTTGGSEGS